MWNTCSNWGRTKPSSVPGTFCIFSASCATSDLGQKPLGESDGSEDIFNSGKKQDAKGNHSY